MSRRGTVVGIDAGGSKVRALMLGPTGRASGVTGGPGNPLSVAEPELTRHYEQALEGFTDVVAVAACVAGVGRPAGRERIERILARRFPGAEIQVSPDYWGAFMCAPPTTDLVVIAGTGSVVCSRADGRAFPVSGGRGWILGDHGSAARLGRALLDRYALSPQRLPASTVDAINLVAGVEAPGELLAAMSAAVSPPSFLGLAAPVLTAAADAGEPWAVEMLRGEMEPLAETASLHADAHLPGRTGLEIGLLGGVWTSPMARSAFTAALEARRPGAKVSLIDAKPVDGALRLAEEMVR